MALKSKGSPDELIILKADIVQKEEDVALDKLVRLQRKDLPEKDIAQKLKKRMEKVFEGHWGCIIGSAFGWRFPKKPIRARKVNMPEREEDAALDKLRRLQHKYTLEKDIAYKLKKHMEKVFEGYWSCIVGSSFGW
ncbi:unnamed protein product [Dibothriocephalus latus]|uniref:Dynein light chain n=1 Tax=Dibothriocephalus latus TaxID=60516 RepID=A0A3P7L7Y0_DIBLA|nr:unnamed protein product [Dibothriocephalus latus]